MKSGIKIRGHVRVTAIRADGVRELLYDDHNLVVNTGFEALAAALAGDINREISHISFGTDGTAPAPGDVAPLAGNIDVALTSAIAAGNTVSFQATMGLGVGNGATYQEIGLLCADGALFARALIAQGAIAKNNTFSIQVDWDISFS